MKWINALTYGHQLQNLPAYATWETPELECSNRSANIQFKIYRTTGGKLALKEISIFPREPRYYKTSDGLVVAFLKRAEMLGIDINQVVADVPLINRIRAFSRALALAGEREKLS
jgi:hypothetical protein